MKPTPSALGLVPVLVLGMVSPVPASPRSPKLPQAFVEGPPPTSTGRLANVPQGSNCQAALNEAQPGDTLVLTAGGDWRLRPDSRFYKEATEPRGVGVSLRELSSANPIRPSSPTVADSRPSRR
jgi:hypothetical protein